MVSISPYVRAGLAQKWGVTPAVADARLAGLLRAKGASLVLDLSLAQAIALEAKFGLTLS